MDWIHCISTTIKIYLKEIWCPVINPFSLNNVNILKTSMTNYLTSTSYTFRICIWKIEGKKKIWHNTGELLPTQTVRCHNYRRKSRGMYEISQVQQLFAPAGGWSPCSYEESDNVITQLNYL